MTARALEQAAAGPRDEGRLCAICQTAIASGETIGRCPECVSPFHVECWEENGGCASYGCALMPETVKENDPTAPETHWGQEEKDCPKCGETIKVAALRCKHCGTVFDTKVPLSRTEFLEKERDAPRVAGGRGSAVAIFVTGLLPFTAPLCLVFGGTWCLANRKIVAKLPATHRVLCIVGLVTSALTTACIVLAVAIHSSVK